VKSEGEKINGTRGAKAQQGAQQVLTAWQGLQLLSAFNTRSR
jgi:hypothetical protein